jgi:hypothetical protein
MCYITKHPQGIRSKKNLKDKNDEGKILVFSFRSPFTVELVRPGGLSKTAQRHHGRAGFAGDPIHIHIARARQDGAP